MPWFQLLTRKIAYLHLKAVKRSVLLVTPNRSALRSTAQETAFEDMSRASTCAGARFPDPTYGLRMRLSV